MPWSIDWPFKSLNNAGKVIKGPFVGALDLTPLLMKQKERPLALCSYKYFRENEFKIPKINGLDAAPKLDAVILTVAYKTFSHITLEKIKAVVNTSLVLIEVRCFFNKAHGTRRTSHFSLMKQEERSLAYLLTSILTNL